MTSKKQQYDPLLDGLPPDLASYVERLRREQPEKYGLDPDSDDMVLEDLDKLAAESELGARLRQHLEEVEAREEAEADEALDQLFFLALEKPEGNA
jgi:hypothetical protein